MVIDDVVLVRLVMMGISLVFDNVKYNYVIIIFCLYIKNEY